MSTDLGTIQRVRELVVSYKPMRVGLPGINPGRLNTTCDAAMLAAALLADAAVEKVLALHLTTKQDLIGVHIVSVGTLDWAPVHVRDVFKAAFLSNAAGLIVAHNHPSGDPTPSPDDVTLAGRLRSAGTLLGVELLDFLIVTDLPARYFSLRDSGLL